MTRRYGDFGINVKDVVTSFLRFPAKRIPPRTCQVLDKNKQMQLAVVLDARFHRTPDGLVWGMQGYEFWKTYLLHFEKVKVIARVQNVAQKHERWKCSSGPNVEFADIPYFVGFAQFLPKYRILYKAMDVAIDSDDAILSRSGNCLDGILRSILRKRKQPYGVQLVNNPYELFKKGAYDSIYRPLLKAYYPRQIKKLCDDASCLTSVSRIVLELFKLQSHIFCNHYSNAAIPEELFRDKPKYHKSPPSPAKILFVGSLANLRKAPDLLIKAVARCNEEGLQLHLKIVGDGQKRPDLEKLVKALNITHCVTFTGHLSGTESIRSELADADIFVLPSHVEGLPRAMIEAMASGLPCIGTNASGIPELLEDEDMVAPGDAIAIAQKIKEVILSPDRLNKMAARNLKKANEEYRNDILRAREKEFLTELKRITGNHLQTK